MDRIIDYTVPKGRYAYYLKVVNVICDLYFEENKLSKRELEFFALCLISLSDGESDVLSKKFKGIFNNNYFVESQTKKQKDSLFCTVRKTLVDKNYLLYNKNTNRISVSPAWGNLEAGLTIKIGYEQK